MSTVIDIRNASDTELRKLVKIPFMKDAVEAELSDRITNAEARIAEAKTRSYTLQSLGGRVVSYTELLHLATVSVKSWYDLPESNIVAEINAEVAAHLAGIQSREANALKAAIAELA